MNDRYECVVCGLSAMDLPDGIDPGMWFEVDEEGRMHCPPCDPVMSW